MKVERVEDRVKRTIVEAMQLPVDPAEIRDEEMLFGGGLGIDSIGTMTIVMGLEREFGIAIGDEDLQLDLFSSITAMADFIRAKTGVAAVSA